jgi:hypothetical protein
MPSSETAAALQQAAAGLTYPSETDAPWATFAWPAAKGAPTAAEVLKQGRRKKGVPVEEQSVDDLFAPLVQEQDWYGPEEKAEAAKNRTLRDAVKQLLAGPKVFRVGARRVIVYVVGQAREGGWAGLKSISVET